MASVRIILVTKSGCGPCAQFLAGPWRTLKDQLSYGIGGAPVDHIDLVNDGIDKIPAPIRKELQFVPWIFAIYDDNTVEPLKSSPNTPPGLAELAEWSSRGPPRYRLLTKSGTRATAPVGDGEDDQRFEIVAVTSSGCAHCAEWESSGKLQKFLDGVPSSFVKTHYNVPKAPPTDNDDMLRRMSLTGVRVPAVVLVQHAKWKMPTAQKLQQRDVLVSPGDVRSPNGLGVFSKWLTMLQDPDTPFLGYLLLATSSSCGHCRRWKDSGGMDKFLTTNGSIPGVLLSHNGWMREAIGSFIHGVPSTFFVPSSEWSSPKPDVSTGPDVSNPEAIAEWVRKIKEGEGGWANDPNFLPAEYQAAAAAREPKRGALGKKVSVPPKRQAFR